MLRAVLKTVATTLKGSDYLIIILAYPYAVPRVFNLLEYLLSIFVLKILSKSDRIRILVDYFDPPVENAYAFSDKPPSILYVLYARMLDLITLKAASFVITITNFWSQHVAKIYHLKSRKILVCPNGVLVKFIHVTPPIDGSFTVLYAGSAPKTKDIDNLISAITSLRQKGLVINLQIAGFQEMELPSWVNIGHYNWPTFVEKLLITSDCCVIPYPPTKMGFYYSLPAKLFDYMAAGKPIIATNLKEVRRIITTFNCGFVAENWKEFETHLEKLYNDRELARELGSNGRRAAEKYFNYELLAEAVPNKLIKIFKNKIDRED